MVIREAYIEAERRLKAAKIENASFEARCLIKDVFKKDPFSEDVFNEAEKLNALIEKRITGYPLQYLIGEWDFYDITLKVGEGVLIPRADTETLVEEALRILKGKKDPKVLDLCSGSGAIPLVLERHVKGEFFAAEKDEKAYFYLYQNNKMYGNRIKTYMADVLSSEFVSSIGTFDVITANPPYLTADEMTSLQKEVSFEPALALFGGDDGLEFYRRITDMYFDKLVSNGALIFEIGYKQGEAVLKILKTAGFKESYIIKDLNGNDRVAVGIRD